MTDRLTIAEIYTAIDDQCHMTFDYLAMCATAGMICGVGLLDDNVVLVVASMLGNFSIVFACRLSPFSDEDPLQLTGPGGTRDGVRGTKVWS